MLKQIQKIFLEILKNNNILSINPHLFLLPSQTEIAYRCAIALQLASKEGNSSLYWAEKIIKCYLKTKNLAFILKVQPDGYLDCFPSSSTLAEWLKHFPNSWALICPKIPLKIDFKHNRDFNLFFCQYVHARCCSLQRLGIREGIIKKYEVIPWFSSTEPLNFSDDREWGLLWQLVYTCDRIPQASPKEILKLMTALSQKFLLFERYCRIFGDVFRNIPHIAQIRLGLIYLTELVLKDLLSDVLQIEPLTEL